MEFASFVISVLAIIGTLYTYFKYDKKIKEQEKRLQEYQIKAFQKEEEINKKADFTVDTIFLGGNKGGRLIIKNIGKSVARNIRYSFNTDKVYGLNDGTYVQLISEQELTLKYYLFLNGVSIENFYIKIEWDDDLQKDNNKIIYLDLSKKIIS